MEPLAPGTPVWWMDKGKKHGKVLEYGRFPGKLYMVYKVEQDGTGTIVYIHPDRINGAKSRPDYA